MFYVEIVRFRLPKLKNCLIAILNPAEVASHPPILSIGNSGGKTSHGSFSARGGSDDNNNTNGGSRGTNGSGGSRGSYGKR